MDFVHVDCTSGNPDEEMVKGLSPFYVGPVECYDGLKSETLERAWQCAKVYPWMVDADGNPSAKYFAWRDEMWGKQAVAGSAAFKWLCAMRDAGRVRHPGRRDPQMAPSRREERNGVRPRFHQSRLEAAAAG